MDFYVYVHVSADDYKPFYVGKGSKKRASEKWNRNPYWKNIAAKHGYSIQIKRHFSTAKEALKYERFLQLKFESKGYRLANLAICGAIGSKGVPHTDEIKKLISKRSVELWDTKEHRDKMSARMTGLNNPFSDKTKYQFFNREQGRIECTQYELRSQYNLNAHHLSAVVNGSRFVCGGWMLLKNKDYFSGFDNRVFKWVHDFHEDHTCMKFEMLKFFPHLEQSSLVRLVQGEYKQSRGWRIQQ